MAHEGRKGLEEVKKIQQHLWYKEKFYLTEAFWLVAFIRVFFSTLDQGTDLEFYWQQWDFINWLFHVNVSIFDLFIILTRWWWEFLMMCRNNWAVCTTIDTKHLNIVSVIDALILWCAASHVSKLTHHYNIITFSKRSLRLLLVSIPKMASELKTSKGLRAAYWKRDVWCVWIMTDDIHTWTPFHSRMTNPQWSLK